MTRLIIRKIGNSLGIVLPREMLARLNLKAGDYLYLTEAHDCAMRITRHDPAFVTQMRIAREGMGKFRNTLCELAR
ncbi:MAG: AbrB/MazE/SpoVT family DNA-binding domain-containing protein [Xanthobacteraceae bacterium]